MLRKHQSDGSSYLDMAEFLHHRGAKQYVEADLEQLFRRVAFNDMTKVAKAVMATGLRRATPIREFQCCSESNVRRLGLA
jgi:hypothetical protein